MRKTKIYHLFKSEKGCAAVYLGSTTSLRDASKICAEHARGERDGLAESDFDTARKIGGGAWMAPPPRNLAGEPCAFFGRFGSYCAAEEVDVDDADEAEGGEK